MIFQMTENLYGEALLKIAEVDSMENSDPSAATELKADIALNYFKKLKQLVLPHQFGSNDEEIRFFKLYKPKLSALSIYYSELYRIELRKPNAGKKAMEDYFQAELQSVQRFYERNREIYSYYRTGASNLDLQLFLRSAGRYPWLCRVREDRDERFTTAADNLFARFLAREQVERYLEASIAGLAEDSHLKQAFDHGMHWTGDSINLLENIFGWYLTGQISHGQITLTELVRKVEQIFGVKLDKPHRRFSEIRQRKRLSKTKFMDEMSNAIIKKIDNEDSL